LKAPSLTPEPVYGAIIDVSFVSLDKVIPSIPNILKPDAEIIESIKLQFAVEREQVSKGGIVHNDAARTTLCKYTLICADCIQSFLCNPASTE
jgi:predicted rRNA methylase YqxC with S4 and FtsJ domains